MPTQEERLAALEQSSASFQKEAVRHIRETEENTTIMLGVIRSQGQDIKRMVQHLETIDGRLVAIDGRLETTDGRLVAIDGRLDAMDGNYHQLQTILNEHTTLLTRILARLGERL